MKSRIVPCNLSSITASRCCISPYIEPDEYGPGKTPVYLNVYDLTQINGYFYWAGLGAFHTGLEVHGIEYAFGAHDFSASGVFEIEPRQCPGYKFRKSIFMGTTTLDLVVVSDFIERQSANYYGDTYHLVAKNCNHFCEDICFKLTGNRIPKWINRLARIGSICHCILPGHLKASAGQNKKSQAYASETKLTSDEESASPLFMDAHCKGCLEPDRGR